MKKALNFIVKHKKPIIIFCCVFVIGVSVYSDFMIRNSEKTSQSDYLYTSSGLDSSDSISDESSKILGEAKLVDNISSVTEQEDTYFASAQLNRRRSRDEAMETLQVVIDSSESMPDVKDEALEQMINIAADIEKEAIVEEMIKAKGFEDCIAVISGENINVIVKSPGLLTNEVAQITEIVTEETGFSPENIKIVEKN